MVLRCFPDDKSSRIMWPCDTHYDPLAKSHQPKRRLPTLKQGLSSLLEIEEIKQGIWGKLPAGGGHFLLFCFQQRELGHGKKLQTERFKMIQDQVATITRTSGHATSN